MLTLQEDVFFTRVGSFTLAGRVLRRYWYPTAGAQDLTPEQPTKSVRVLCPDLIAPSLAPLCTNPPWGS